MMSLVWKYLKQQKKRTILTVLGIMLACALVASVGIFFSSFQKMMVTQSAYDSGTFDALLSGALDQEDVQKIKDNFLVENSGLECQNSDLRRIDASGIGKTYYLRQLDTDAHAFFPKEMAEGRRPENSAEVMISSMHKELGEVGDTIPLSLYYQIYDKKTGEANELEAGTVSLKIVGIYSTKSRWGTIFTGGFLPGAEEYGEVSQYVTFKSGVNKSEALKTLLKDTGLEESVGASLNEGYLMWRGERGSDGMQNSIKLTLLLLSAIILLAMASVIRNSFAMSVSEKMSQFGSLRCVGASPGQIRNMVLGEAFLTWIIAIPLGILLGIGAMAVTFSVVQGIDLEALQYFQLVLEPGPFLITILFSLVAVLLSARAPARSAARISAIEAVRGSTAFRDTAVRGKGGALLGKLFGFTGSLAGKNIRRNKKRYRTTVFSVTLSIALFICIGGFGQKMVQSISMFSDVKGVDFEFSYTGGNPESFEETYRNMDKLREQVSLEPGVEELALLETTVCDLLVPKAQISRELSELGESGESTLKDQYGEPLIDEKGSMQQTMVYFINREIYEKLELSEGAPTYDELVAQKGVLLNPTAVVSSLDSGLTSYPIGSFQVGEKLWMSGYYYRPAEASADREANESEEGKDIVFQLPISGFVEKTPWFNTRRFNPQLFLPQENRSLVAEQGDMRPSNDTLYLRVKAAPEAKETVNQRMKEYEKDSYRLNNIYEQEKENRNVATVLNIFIYGFLAVVIVICSLNLFNTIHANLRMRKREIAMLRAVGMDNRKLWKSLLLECVLYGVIGTLWGSILGFSLQIMLSYAVAGAIEVELLASPLLYIGGSLVASIVVCLLAGVGPIRRLIKSSIVEEIRAQE